MERVLPGRFLDSTAWIALDGRDAKVAVGR